MKRIGWILAVLLCGWVRLASAELLAFGPESLREIERQHSGAPVAVVIWSTDCAPCRGELALLQRFATEHADANIVLIAADDMSNAATVRAVLAEYGLESAENWIFSDQNRERLQYSIDLKWFGELPRAYLYSRAHARRAVSGTLSKAQLEGWLAEED